MAQAQPDLQIFIKPCKSKITHIDLLAAARSNSLVGFFTIIPTFALMVEDPNVVGNIMLRVSSQYKHENPL